ncbi:MAG: ATP-binding cassette domain-containing protein, partial [Acetobacteraceae bacterium]
RWNSSPGEGGRCNVADLLSTSGLTRRFGGLLANDRIDFALEMGALRCVIGPNGAGKTTFISMISGHLPPSSGRISFNGIDITRFAVERRAQLGICRKFQTPSLFMNLTVAENVELAVLATARAKRERRRRIEEVLKLIRLADLREESVNALTHGQRQWLEVGLLIAKDSVLLLLDEPTAGMTAEETRATGALIKSLLGRMSLSIIIIEHDVKFIRDLAAPITVLHQGRVLCEGDFATISEDSRVRDIYLGAE